MIAITNRSASILVKNVISPWALVPTIPHERRARRDSSRTVEHRGCALPGGRAAKSSPNGNQSGSHNARSASSARLLVNGRQAYAAMFPPSISPDGCRSVGVQTEARCAQRPRNYSAANHKTP